jgi:hypothetical protein
MRLTGWRRLITHRLHISNTYDGDGNLTQSVKSDPTDWDPSRTSLAAFTDGSGRRHNGPASRVGRPLHP